MPHAAFWFTGTALYVATSFTFTTVVGLIGIKQIIPKREYYVCFGFALILSLGAWSTAALQEQASAEQAAQNREFKNILAKLAQRLNVPLQAPPSSLISKLDEIVERSKLREWEPLHPDQSNALVAKLKLLPAQKIGIGCASPECKELANQIADSFRRAGWNPIKHFGGGLGIDGVTSINIYSCNGTSAAIQKSIESATQLKVSPHEDEGCSDFDFLVVGEKPF